MRVGDIIDGKYRIEAPLGEGGMGRVFAASHEALGSTVAIKVLRSEALASPEVPKRFSREARAAARLRSEHVVRVSDVGALASGEPYMVMEMLHGHDLASRLKHGPLPAVQAVDYIVQACEGLAEAHAMGMVHRDIKPGNLFVTARANGQALIKVLDFGIATAATGDLKDPKLTTTQSVMGSPSYMSPEQLKGARDVDARSDIWSLGVTLYELLSGQQPFVGPTLTALSLAIVTDPYPKLEGIDPVLAEVIDRCLQKNAVDRYPNVAALSRALAPLFTGGFVAADLVAGSYKMPVPPTLLGLEQSLGTQQTVLPAASQAIAAGSRVVPAREPMMTSTTSLASGETGTHLPQQGRKWVWITAAVATIALGIGVGVMVGMSGGKNTASAAEPPKTIAEQPKPPPQVEPPKLTEPVKPEPEPVRDVAAELRAVEAAARDKDLELARTLAAKLENTSSAESARAAIARVEDKLIAQLTVELKRTVADCTKYLARSRDYEKYGGEIIAKAQKAAGKCRRDRRTPVEPYPPRRDPDPVKVDPPKVDPPKVDPPKVDPPKKQPCAPNDPRCGL